MRTTVFLPLGSTLLAVPLGLAVLQRPASAQKPAPAPRIPTAKVERTAPPQLRAGHVTFSDCTFTAVTPCTNCSSSSCTNCSGSSFKVTTELRNNSNSAISFQAGQVMASYSRTDWQEPYRASKTMPAPGGGMYLAPGASTPLSDTFGPLSSGIYEFAWTVDPDNHLRAPKLVKNCSITVSGSPLTGGRPDLTFTSVLISPTSGTSSDSYVFTLRGKNRGHGNIPIPTKTDCKIDGATFTNPVQLGSPPAGNDFSQTVNRSAGLTPGTHKLDCVLDFESRLREEFEDNNTISQTFVVRAP